MGELTRKGEFRPMTLDDLAAQERARDMQARQEVPVLQQSDNPHEYLYFAMFDGTGQDADNPGQEKTNVGLLRDQLDELKQDPNLRVGYGYTEGIGTQDHALIRGPDKLLAFSWDEKIENAYRQLANQAKEWKEQDPEAQIRVAGVGYSRGAVQSAGLARLIDEYGILDPDDLRFGRDAQGNITVESDRPPLMAPGTVAQALGLYDPVATGFPRNYDARTPPSVISATALAARDEDREDFAHQTILQPGLSDDRRFANLLVPGGHSNVGGGNRDTGVEAMSFNTMADYLNGLRDQPIINHRELPADLSQYTVFQARGASAIRGMDKDELRDLRAELANCKIVDPCREGEPVDQALAGQFQYRTLQPVAPLPDLVGMTHMQSEQTEKSRQPLANDPAHPDHATYGRIHDWGRGTGQWDEGASHNVSSALYREHAADPELKRVDKVTGGLGSNGEQNVFAVYAPFGDKGPFLHAHVDGREAAMQPARESLEQAEQAKQKISQQQQLEQQQEQEQQARRVPQMGM